MNYFNTKSVFDTSYILVIKQFCCPKFNLKQETCVVSVRVEKRYAVRTYTGVVPHQ